MEEKYINKILEQKKLIKAMQENEDSAIKIMKMYEEEKKKNQKAIDWVNNHFETYIQNGIGIIDWNHNADPRKLLDILEGEKND